MNIHPVGAELLHADGQTDMTKLVVAFRNFVTAPKNGHMFQPCFFLSLSGYIIHMLQLLLRDIVCHKHIQLSKLQYFTLSVLMYKLPLRLFLSE
jgi:hypothetical protein